MQKNIQAVERSLLAGRGARRRLPGGGHVQIDRLQPFLVVHRRRSAGTDQATDKLVTHSASPSGQEIRTAFFDFDNMVFSA